MVNIYYTLSNLFTHLSTHSLIQLTMPQFTNIQLCLDLGSQSQNQTQATFALEGLHSNGKHTFNADLEV